MAIDGYLSREYHQRWDESQQIPARAIGMLAFQLSSLQTRTFVPLAGAQNLIEFNGTVSRVFVHSIAYTQLNAIPGLWADGAWTKLEPGRYEPPIDRTTVVIVVSVVAAAVVVAIIIGVIIYWRMRIKKQAGLSAATLTTEAATSLTYA
jgi:phosphate/sulfate permease